MRCAETRGSSESRHHWWAVCGQLAVIRFRSPDSLAMAMVIALIRAAAAAKSATRKSPLPAVVRRPGWRRSGGKPAAEGGGQLVAQRCSGVPVSGGEDLGGERGERPVDGRLHQRHGDQEAEQHAEDGAGGDQQQDRVDRDDRGDSR